MINGNKFKNIYYSSNILLLQSEKRLSLVTKTFNINQATQIITEKLQQEVENQQVNIRSAEIFEIKNALENLKTIIPIYDDITLKHSDDWVCNYNFEQIESEYYALSKLLNLPTNQRRKRNVNTDSVIANEYIKNWKLLKQTSPDNSNHNQVFIQSAKDYIEILNDDKRIPVNALKIIATDFDVFLKLSSSRHDYIVGIKTVMNIQVGFTNGIITRSGKILLNQKRKLDEELAVQENSKEPRITNNINQNRRKQASRTMQSKIHQGKNSKIRIDDMVTTTENDDGEMIIYERTTKTTLLNEIVNSGYTVENLRITQTESDEINKDLDIHIGESTISPIVTMPPEKSVDTQLTGHDVNNFIDIIPTTTIDNTEKTVSDFNTEQIISSTQNVLREMNDNDQSQNFDKENINTRMSIDEPNTNPMISTTQHDLITDNINKEIVTRNTLINDIMEVDNPTMIDLTTIGITIDNDDDINKYNSEYYRTHQVTKRQNQISEKDANQDKMQLENANEIYKLKEQDIQSRINQISLQLNQLGRNFNQANREVLGKICELELFGIANQTPLKVYTQVSEASIMRPITFCTDKFCYQLIMDQLFLELKNGLKCHNAKIVRDGYGVCLDLLSNHDHVCALDQNSEPCKYKEILYEEAKPEIFNEGTALLNPHENVIYNNIIDKQTKVEGQILEKSSAAFILPRVAKLYYVFSKRQIRNSYVDKSSTAYQIYDLIENAQYRDTLTYIGVILSIFGIFGLISQISSTVYKICCMPDTTSENEDNRLNVVKIKEPKVKIKRSATNTSETRPLTYKIVRSSN